MHVCVKVQDEAGVGKLLALNTESTKSSAAEITPTPRFYLSSGHLQHSPHNCLTKKEVSVRATITEYKMQHKKANRVLSTPISVDATTQTNDKRLQFIKLSLKATLQRTIGQQKKK